MRNALTKNSVPVSIGASENSDGDLIVYADDIITSDNENVYYITMSFLGGGTFGKVYCVKSSKDKNHYALKISSLKSDSFEQMKNETDTLAQLNQMSDEIHITKMHDCFLYLHHLCCVMELYNSSIFDLIVNRDYRGFPLIHCQRLLRDIVHGLRFVHRYNYIHTDVKPENIAISSSNRGVLIDFGAAGDVSKFSPGMCLESLYYRAPEVMLGMRVNQKIDIWSLGATIAEVYLGLPIFAGDSEQQVLQLIQTRIGKFPDALLQTSVYANRYFDNDNNVIIDESFEDPCQFGFPTLDLILRFAVDEAPTDPLMSFIDLIKHMLEIDPENRYSVENVADHPFIHMKISN